MKHVRLVQPTDVYGISNGHKSKCRTSSRDLNSFPSLVTGTSINFMLLSYRVFNGLNGVKIENQGKQSMLVFFNVSEEDYGNYTCVAVNPMGITNASIILYGKIVNGFKR